MKDNSSILNNSNAELAREIFLQAMDLGLNFKLQDKVRKGEFENLAPEVFVDELPEEGAELSSVMQEFEERFLPYCYNFASPNFMGFPDAGNSVAGIVGSVLADFLQQNMINQSFCSPSGTFAEIAVIRWLREIVGYTNNGMPKDIFDVGGIVTGGGTTSNATGILLARENFRSRTMQNGVQPSDGYYLMVPKGIGHYSVKSAQMWVGCGNKLIEVETNNYRYDLHDLQKKLKDYEGKIMGLVAYAGDSRTMTVDNFKAVADIVRSSGQNIWLHADACHGFSLGFSSKLRKKLAGIEEFDSITTDPHKVMNIPYTLSALLVKNPGSLKTINSLSDLIMQEQYAFGQVTPYIGSKPWISLKLWFAIKNMGRQGYEKIIEDRHKLACDLADMLKSAPDFVLLNEVDINSVAFLYTGKAKKLNASRLNQLNRAIHSEIIREGRYHIHQFSIPDAGLIKKGVLLYPLRYMGGNPNTTSKHLIKLLDYIRSIGMKMEEK